MTEEPKTLYEHFMFCDLYTANKHGRPYSKVRDYVNSMTNIEFLMSLSYALEEMLKPPPVEAEDAKEDSTPDYTVTPEQVNGSHRMFGLSSSLTKDDIEKVLGFKPNIDDDPDKVTSSWGFRVKFSDGDHDRGAIWDYKGSRWSAFGDRDIFDILFPGMVTS